jgi:glycosyltransferase involved in cell wall biosynthesis
MDRKSAPRSVLHVNTRDRYGGAESSAWNLFKALQHRGLDSWMAVGQKTSDDAAVLEIPNESSRNRLVRACVAAPQLFGIARGLRWMAEPMHGLDSLRGVEDFHYPGTRRLLDLPPRRPDILHCHNLHGDFFDLRRLPWLSSQLPVIFNLRDTWAFTGHCAGFQDCGRWKTGCGRCPDLAIYPAIKRDTTRANWLRKSRIYSRSRLYVSVASQWMMDQVSKSMLRGAQLKLIPNGIDFDVFRPGDQAGARRALDLPAGARIVLITAHSMLKPLEVMLRVLRSVELPGERVIAVCVAKTGPFESWPNGGVIYRPHQYDPKAMALYYQAADAFLQVATSESFGKAIVESMACGTPVVCNAVAATPELISNHETGMLVPDSTEAALAHALSRVLTDEGLRLRIIRQGLEFAHSRFSLDRQVAAFLDWYEEVIADWTRWRLDTDSPSKPDT